MSRLNKPVRSRSQDSPHYRACATKGTFRSGRNFWNAFLSNFNKQKFVFYIAKLTKDDLNVLRELMQSGKVAPVIDRTYKMSETQAALRYLEEGHAHGKVVISTE